MEGQQSLAQRAVDALSRLDEFNRHSWLGATAAAPRDRSTALGYAMPNAKKPLEPDDFPVNAEEKKIKKHDGTPLADTDDPAVAADVAERLNDDEARREEDKWSA
jgi:hypothetical protein